MSMLLYLRYIIMGLNVVSFLMCIIALVMFILRYSHALYNYLNVNSVVKSISIIWYVFLLFMLLKLIAAFSLKNLVIFLLAGVIGTLIQRFIVSWVKGWIFGMDIHSAISIAIKNANIGVGVFYVILFAITTVLAYVSVNAINMTLVSQNIDITIWFDVIRNLILIILLMYCRVRTCSVTTTFLWNTRYFLDKVESEKGKFIDKMEKSIHEKGSQAFETLTKEYGKFCKRYSSEAGQTLFYTIILMYRSDKAVFQFVEYICNKYGSNLVELMTNNKEKADKILNIGSDLFEIYKRLIEMYGFDYLDVIFKPF